MSEQKIVLVVGPSDPRYTRARLNVFSCWNGSPDFEIIALPRGLDSHNIKQTILEALDRAGFRFDQALLLLTGTFGEQNEPASAIRAFLQSVFEEQPGFRVTVVHLFENGRFTSIEL